MNFSTNTIPLYQVTQILSLMEDHFTDFKSKRIRPSKLSETISAFANTSGGDVYVGIEEDKTTGNKQWNGFLDIEEANGIFQMLDNLSPIGNDYNATFLKNEADQTLVLQISVNKQNSIVKSTEGIPYVRRGAQKLPINTSEKLRRLELDKGIVLYENEIVTDSDLNDLNDSKSLAKFASHIIPHLDSPSWLEKQKLIRNGHVTVAGLMLFSDEPQIFLPKRSAIKIFRYKTAEEADRDMLDSLPITVEGCAYEQIYEAVQKTKEIVESIKKLDKGFVKIEYPEETIHEIITNAVIHRDYSIMSDIQIRIFDNRIEIESPGKLPGHVTVKNILSEQSARNPKIVRLINKFPNPPNKDVGEGLNTAFEAMNKLRLKPPFIEEKELSVLVTIKHEKLASPEETIMKYMETHDSICNKEGRELTGIKSENSMKRVFYKLKEQNLLERIPHQNGAKAAWKKTNNQ